MLSTESLERLFDELAQAIDRVGPEDESLMLTKLVFLLAHQVGDEATVQQAIGHALKELG